MKYILTVVLFSFMSAEAAVAETNLFSVSTPEAQVWSQPRTNTQLGLSYRFGVPTQEAIPYNFIQITVEIANESDSKIRLIAEGGHTNMLRCAIYDDAERVGRAPNVGGPLPGDRSFGLPSGATSRSTLHAVCFVKTPGEKSISVGVFAAPPGVALADATELQTAPIEIVFGKTKDAQQDE